METMQQLSTLNQTRATLESVTDRLERTEKKLSPAHWSAKEIRIISDELTREIDKLTAAIDAARGGK